MVQCLGERCWRFLSNVTISLQLIDLGAVLHPGSYFRSKWNFIDALVVCCNIASLVLRWDTWWRCLDSWALIKPTCFTLWHFAGLSAWLNVSILFYFSHTQSNVSGQSFVKVLRVLRVFRPLKMMNKLKKLEVYWLIKYFTFPGLCSGSVSIE
jgi:hypothetical protein